MVRFRSVALAIGLLVAMGAQADVRLPALFSDHMVVQRGRPIPVWGWGTPGQAISVSLAGARGQASVGPDSTWRLELAPLSAGGPHQLVVEGDGSVVVDDVLVGEVWVGSGQSNMQWTVSAADNSEAEIAAADHPGIRLFHVPRRTAAQRQTDVDAAWQVCSPETIPGFSAVAYFFGRRLHEELDVPIGLIHSSWGGPDRALDRPGVVAPAGAESAGGDADRPRTGYRARRDTALDGSALTAPGVRGAIAGRRGGQHRCPVGGA